VQVKEASKQTDLPSKESYQNITGLIHETHKNIMKVGACISCSVKNFCTQILAQKLSDIKSIPLTVDEFKSRIRD